MAWNVLTAPNAFDNAAWAKQSNCQITADQATNPGGVTQDADELELQGSSARAFGQKYTPGAAPNGQKWSFGIWVKSDTAYTLRVTMGDQTDPLNAGTATDTTVTNHSILGDEKWHYHEAVHTFSAGSNTAISANVFLVATTGALIHIAWARLKRDGFHHPVRRAL